MKKRIVLKDENIYNKIDDYDLIGIVWEDDRHSILTDDINTTQVFVTTKRNDDCLLTPYTEQVKYETYKSFIIDNKNEIKDVLLFETFPSFLMWWQNGRKGAIFKISPTEDICNLEDLSINGNIGVEINNKKYIVTYYDSNPYRPYFLEVVSNMIIEIEEENIKNFIEKGIKGEKTSNISYKTFFAYVFSNRNELYKWIIN